MKKNNKGFTLVEVLCVLVILAIIALLVANTFVKTVNDAKQKVTESQEKAILSAAEKWTIDNSDIFDDIDVVIKNAKLDVMFIVDVSGSMEQNTLTSGEKRFVGAAKAINSALDTFKSSELDVNIGFVFYSGGVDDATYNNKQLGGFVPLHSLGDARITTGSTTLKYNGKTVNIYGGTYTQGGIIRGAQELVDHGEEGRIPVIVLLTDGDPTYYTTVSTGCSTDWWGNTTCSYNDDFETNALKYVAGGTNSSQLGGNGSSTTYKETWATVRSAYLAKEAVRDKYKVDDVDFYTISVGVTSNKGRFIVMTHPFKDVNNQEVDYLNDLKMGDSNDVAIYNRITSEKGKGHEYDYVTKNYSPEDSDKLVGAFNEIATNSIKKAGVTAKCITLDDLYQGGYISKKDVSWADTEQARETYVLVKEQKATNQFSFYLAKDGEDLQTCKELLAKEQESQNNNN